MSIKDSLTAVQAQIPANVRLIAVSKTHPIEKIQEVYEVGIRDFGENRVQELMEKAPHLPADIRWHLIGTLQRNKVKYIAPFIHLIHSVDSVSLLEEIQKQARKNNRTIPVLLQIHVAQEETKSGFDPDELVSLARENFFQNWDGIEFHGIMAMASNTDNVVRVRSDFQRTAEIYSILKNTAFLDNPLFKEISMGMSGDFPMAIEMGATLVRVGSLIFGSR